MNAGTVGLDDVQEVLQLEGLLERTDRRELLGDLVEIPKRRDDDDRDRCEGRVIELALSESERAAFEKSVDAVKALVDAMARLTA